MSEATYGFLGLVIGAVLGCYGSLIAAWWVRGHSEKQLFVQTVTNERSVWRQDLRAATGQLIRCAYEYLEDQSSEKFCAIQEHRVSVRLRLNPSASNKHPLDSEIMAILDRLGDQRQIAEGGNLSPILGQLERAVQNLLKQEWEKSKREAINGRLEGSRKEKNGLMCCIWRMAQ